MAAYGAPPGVVSSGYGHGADTVVAAEHQHRHPSLAHPQTDPASPPFPFAPQGSPRAQRLGSFSHYAGDDVSTTYPDAGSGGGGNYTTSSVMQDPFEIPPAKRQKVSDVDGGRRPNQATAATKESPARRESMAEASPSYRRDEGASRGRERGKGRRDSDSLDPKLPKASPSASKPKRVRTGCLTCRNRHLKCDEAMPICINCQKSNRKCERGVRLNFIDLKVEQPPYLLPPVDWKGKSFRICRCRGLVIGCIPLPRLGLPLNSKMRKWL